MPAGLPVRDGIGHGAAADGGRLRAWLPGLLLVVTALAAYYPSLHGKFIFDDGPQIGEADSYGFWSIWFEPTCLYQYYPLANTTLCLDWRWWGEWMLPYHLQNVLLHGLSAVLFWKLLRRLQVPGAWLAAAIFTLHPMMVESVAWISERKNVLTQAFYLGAFLQYGRCVDYWREPGGTVKRSAWVLALILFVVALCSKVTAFSFPPAILLVCWWKRGTIRWRDVRPLLPFFGVAVIFGVFSVWMEKHSSGAMGADWELPWSHRFLLAGRALWFYLGKLVWPQDLCFIYPKWNLDASAPGQWLFPLGVVAAAGALFLARKRVGRGTVAAFLFYVGNLLPVLGFLNVYAMLYSYVADRWVYLPSLGLIALASAGLVRASERLRRPVLVRVMGAIFLAGLAVLTWRQAGLYKDGLTIWEATIKLNPGAPVAHVNLGNSLYKENKVKWAAAEYRKALELRPQDGTAHSNLARMLELEGEFKEAEPHYQEALRLAPSDDKTRHLYASMLTQLGRGGEALYLLQAERIPSGPQGGWGDFIRLAWTLATSPDPLMRSARHAVDLAERADKVFGHKNVEVLEVLAAAYAEAGRFQEAVDTAQKALALTSNASIADALRAELACYQQNKPYRDQPAPAGAKP